MSDKPNEARSAESATEVGEAKAPRPGPCKACNGSGLAPNKRRFCSTCLGSGTDVKRPTGWQ